VLNVAGNVVSVSNSLYQDEMPSYSASDICIQAVCTWHSVASGGLGVNHSLLNKIRLIYNCH